MELINDFLSSIFAFIFDYIKVSYFLHQELLNFIIANEKEYWFASLFFSILSILALVGIVKIFVIYTIKYTYSYETFQENDYFKRLYIIVLIFPFYLIFELFNILYMNKRPKTQTR